MLTEMVVIILKLLIKTVLFISMDHLESCFHEYKIDGKTSGGLRIDFGSPLILFQFEENPNNVEYVIPFPVRYPSAIKLGIFRSCSAFLRSFQWLWFHPFRVIFPVSTMPTIYDRNVVSIADSDNNRTKILAVALGHCLFFEQNQHTPPVRKCVEY